MKQVSMLKWTSLMMSAAMLMFSCGGDDDEPAKPEAIFEYSVDAGNLMKINFTNKSKNATSYVWDFGDGTGSTEESPSHVFEEEGSFMVTMSAANGNQIAYQATLIQVSAKLTKAVLTGGTTRSWKLKPAGGAFIVGPSIGSGEWYPGYTAGAHNDISGARPCLFNDEFIFSMDGTYAYETNGDIWAEDYMGYAAGDFNKCQDDETLPTAAQVWGSKSHTYTFTEAAGADKAKITVTGLAAFIALPKAKNDGEFASPPSASGSVTYDVVNYAIVDGVENLTITIDIGPGYWTFVLVPTE